MNGAKQDCFESLNFVSKRGRILFIYHKFATFEVLVPLFGSHHGEAVGNDAFSVVGSLFSVVSFLLWLKVVVLLL